MGEEISSHQVRAALPEAALAVVRPHAPEGVELLSVDDDIDLDTIDFLVPRSGQADLLEVLPDLPRVAVIQTLSAGTDWIEQSVPEQATLCSARGARDAPVAEWVLGALLGASTGQLEYARRRQWDQHHLQDLAAWTVLVVGMGSIGRRVQSHLLELGATVLGVASRAREDLHGIKELPELLPQADAVVLLVPLSAETHGLIGPAELAAMPDGALLVNAARGAVVDTDALVAETQTDRLRAVLDVTDPEPLPPDHPLWEAPGVLTITPHVGGDSPRGHRQAAELAGEQLARWCAGEELLNVVKQGSV